MLLQESISYSLRIYLLVIVWYVSLIHPADDGSMVLRNICILSHYYMTSEPRRP